VDGLTVKWIAALVTAVTLAMPGGSRAAEEITAPGDAGQTETPPSAEPSSPPPDPHTAPGLPVEPDPADTHYMLGEQRVRSGDLIGAVEEFREAARLQPNRPEPRLGLGTALYQMGDLEAAIDAYRALLKLQPDLAMAHLNLATAHMVKQEWADARDAVTSALRLQPDLTQAHYTLGMVRYRLGDRAGAIDAFREALNQKPDFIDAHYHLGLLLQASNQEADAVQEFYAAAIAGLPKAQYFLGSALASGRGVARDLPVAIHWWFLAADQDVGQAKEALSHLRQSAVIKGKRSANDAKAAQQAFADFRKEMWKAYPEFSPEPDLSLGEALLKEGHVDEAVPVLLREAYALSAPAESALETLYDQGLEGSLSPHDPRILDYFRTTADEGLPGPRLVMARLYVRGQGVPEDLKKAKALLRGNPKEEAKALLREISTKQQNHHNTGKGQSTSP
jgi:tetratricopeptide (TPR) repeat protein